MEMIIDVSTEHGKARLTLHNCPDVCPICNKGIDPRSFGGYLDEVHTELEAIFQCPRVDCRHLFIAHFVGVPISDNPGIEFILDHLEPIYFEQREFDEIISSVSNDFVRIYNQAKQAEELNLSEIAGPGFRKSLEFLARFRNGE